MIRDQLLPDRRRYAVLGTGALGGYYGACLQRSGQEVHFLLNSDYDQVRERGLKIESCTGDFDLPQVNAYRDPAAMPRCEVVIVALKALQNDLFPQVLPPVIADRGVVVLLQNGLDGERVVAEVVGSDRVIGGLCFISSNKVGPGWIRHLDYGAILLGEYGSDYQPQPITPRLNQIAADFKQAGIPIDLSEDLLQARWQKLVWNIPFNGLSVIFRATTDQMMMDPDARVLAEQLMREVQRGAGACGRRIKDEILQDMIAKTEKMASYSTSMKLDYERGRPLEIEAIFGNPLRAAESAGAQLPKIRMLYHQLKMLDRSSKSILNSRDTSARPRC